MSSYINCPRCEELKKQLAAKEKELGEAKQMLKECHLYIIGGIMPAREAGFPKDLFSKCPNINEQRCAVRSRRTARKK